MPRVGTVSDSAATARPSTSAGREFGQVLASLRTATGGDEPPHPVIADRLGALLRATMLVAFRHSYSDQLDDDRGRARVPDAVRRVIDAVEHDPMQVRTAVDAARIAHLSLRALESGFERHVGVSPTAYARRVRLARAREDLVRADPADVTVLGVARRWGFGHAGRFAASYRERYGESPSRTLHRYE